MTHDELPIAPPTPAEQTTPSALAAVAPGEGVDDADFDLDCPTCGATLAGAEAFERYGVCPSCHRHFSMPARARLATLVDPDCFQETNAALVSVDPIVFHDHLPGLARETEPQERALISDAVITGIGGIGGHSAVLVLIDHVYLGGSIGAVAGEKIALAMELAVARRLPLIAFCSGGAPRIQEGILSLLQIAKSASLASRLHRVGVPMISVLTHPATGSVYAGLANQADIILAEPGARIGFGAARGPAGVPSEGGGAQTAEMLLAGGMIDDVVDRTRLRDYLGRLLDLLAVRGVARPAPPLAPLAGAGRGWDAGAMARHPERPTSLAYIRRMLPDFMEFHGDRTAADDPAVICGIGRLDGLSVAVIAQERGHGTEAARRNAGRMTAAGYRKAARLLRLAGHLELPVLVLIDSPGAATGIDAEAGGIGVAIAQTLGLMTMLPVPIVSVVVGSGAGAGALALAAGDRILMQEHAVFAAVGPESAGSPHYRAGDRAAETSTSLLLTARDCERLGIVETVIPEPGPAAHADPDFAATQVRLAVAQALAELTSAGPRRLLDERSRKLRFLGQTTPEGREATRLELRELQELQRSLTRSLDELRHDLRDRWEHRNVSLTLPHLPSLPNLPMRLHLHRPDLGDLAGRFSAFRSSIAPPSTVVIQPSRDEAGPATPAGPPQPTESAENDE